MCMIVDANKLGSLLSDKPTADVVPIHDWLNKRSGKLVYSTDGGFADEAGGRSAKRLAGYARAGRATVIPTEAFAEDERQLRNNKGLRSDDPHVLALARYSRARVLYTADADLIRDFKDKQFIAKPRGKVYSGSQNARLLTRSTCRL